MRLLVISDLHVGAGVLDDCDAELERGIVAFLDEVAAHPVPTTLVINGDFLDFAQAEPWQSKDLEATAADRTPLCFTEEQSVEKLKAIIGGHGAIFAALCRLTAPASKHQVVILPGNHDADFFWKRVRREFLLAVANGCDQPVQRLRFHLAQSYRPEHFPDVWIEHGHQHDACNRFAANGAARWSADAKPILADRSGVPRLLECAGTRFLIRFLNALDAEYPFVDNVKPFSKFVKMFLSATVHRDFGPLEALVAYWAFLRFFAETLGKSPLDLLTAPTSPKQGFDRFRDRLLALRQDDARGLHTALRQRGFDFKGMPLEFYIGDDFRLEILLDFLCAEPELLRGVGDEDMALLSAGDQGYLTLGVAYLADETAALRSAARKIIADRQATAVIMGHTHEPVMPDAALNYLNIGCWTRYLRQSKQWSWRLLKKSAYENFPYEFGYAEVSGARRASQFGVSSIRKAEPRPWPTSP
jgi:UDP-2,3-diacylglucosamine pyrophosphatase LpxH